jgi:serralysin
MTGILYDATHEENRYSGFAEATGAHGIKYVDSGNNRLANSVLTGLAWNGSAITYSFPDSRKDYTYTTSNGEKDDGFAPVNQNIMSAARFALDLSYGSAANNGFSLEGFTNMNVSQGSDAGSTLKYAQSNVPSTAWGYYPQAGATGGDVWFGKTEQYLNAEAGNFAWATVIHETGHALGLKHGHETFYNSTVGETFPTLPADKNSLEYSIMTYHSYVGWSAGYDTTETWGAPQTFMMADIAALQRMYGADYNTNDGNTVYSWKPTTGNTYVNGKIGIDPGGNRIFATIWDGGGKDTYDLSAYSSNLRIDLTPGGHSKFSNHQLSDLGYDINPGAHMARGNIFNAMLYKGNLESIIENAIGGSGNDKLQGNEVGNRLKGNGGEDVFWGMGGYDTYAGGGGADKFVFKRGWDHDTIADFGNGNDRIDLQSYNFKNFSALMSHATRDGQDVRFAFGNGDSLVLEHTTLNSLHQSDFIL